MNLVDKCFYKKIIQFYCSAIISIKGGTGTCEYVRRFLVLLILKK
jgi:hypothetical protein